MAVRAGQAFIAIGPSFRGFKSETEAWVKTNLRAIEVEVKPKVSKKPIILPPVKGKDVKVGVDVDRSRFERSISAIESRLDRLSRGRFLINVGIALAPLAAPALAASVGGVLAAGGLGAAGVAGIAGVAGLGVASLKRLATEQTNVKATTKAVTTAANSLQSAQRGVISAERGVVSAERTLKDSQDKVRESLKALHAARLQAIKDLADLKEKTSDDALSTEAAQIGLIDAQAELARVQADTTSTALDLRKAKLGVAQAEDALSDSRKQGATDAKALAKAQKDGIGKAPGVVAARRAVKQAKEDRATARQGVRDARSDLAAAESDAAAAQAVFAKAQAAQAKALGALTPAQKKAALGVKELKKNWNGFLDNVDVTLLPALVTGMVAINKVLPAVAMFMRPVAVAAGQMFAAFGNAAGTKGFRIFAKDFGVFTASVAGDATTSILNLARGFGNLLLAFMPLSTDMSKGLVGLTADFATWTAGLQGSNGFTGFSEYVKTNGPLILSTLGSVGMALLAIGKAAAPLGHDLLIGITALANFISTFAAAHPGITSGIVGVIALSSALSALAVPLARVFGLFRIITSPVLGAVKAWRLHTAAVRAGKAETFAFRIQYGLLRAQEIATTIVTKASTAATKTWAFFQGLAGKAALGTRIQLGILKVQQIASAVATKTVAIATKAMTAGQWLFNAALTANPIGLVAVGLVALGATFVILYKKVGWFRAGVNAMWAGLKVGFAWAKDHWPLLLIILTGPIGVAVVIITKNFDKIRSGIGKVSDAFSTAKRSISSVWGKIADAITHPLDTIKKALNVFFKGIDKIASFFGGSFNFRFDTSTPVKKNVSSSTHSGPIAMASGGVLPGWSPGRDIHTFTSPTGGKLRLSGGESVMVPEWTAAMGGEKAIAAINIAARRGQAFAKGGVVWPTRGKHWTTYTGHDGIDLNGPGNGLGAPYFAATSGIVTYTGTGHGYGNEVELRSSRGPTLRYGHSSAIFVKPGQHVQAGQTMGHIGFSGHVIPAGPAGSHLHFGLVGEGPDEGKAARNFLAGAHMGSGSDGLGGGFNPLSDIRHLIKETTGMVANLHAGPFGALLKKAPEKIGSLAIARAKQILNPVDDIEHLANHLLGRGGAFDDGGIATSAGLMFKNTMRPERVLSPSQTAAFESALSGGGGDLLELTGDLTLTEDSRVMIRGVAQKVVSDNDFKTKRDLRFPK